jgi:hypothetical protein
VEEVPTLIGKIAQTQEIIHSQPPDENGRTGIERPQSILEEDFRLGTREKVAFTVLLTMSFYAALESTSIGVALPASLSSKTPFLNTH